MYCIIRIIKFKKTRFTKTLCIALFTCQMFCSRLMTPGLCLEDHGTAQGLRRRAVALRIAVGAEVLLHGVGGLEETYSFLHGKLFSRLINKYNRERGWLGRLEWLSKVFNNDDITTLLIASTPSQTKCSWDIASGSRSAQGCLEAFSHEWNSSAPCPLGATAKVASKRFTPPWQFTQKRWQVKESILASQNDVSEPSRWTHPWTQKQTWRTCRQIPAPPPSAHMFSFQDSNWQQPSKKNSAFQSQSWKWTMGSIELLNWCKMM